MKTNHFLSTVKELINELRGIYNLTYIEKNYAEWRINENSLMIASYPRSGNTWLRYLLASAFYFIGSGKLEKLEHYQMYKYIPTLMQKDNKTLEAYNINGYHLVKTHSNYLPVYKSAILLYRNPVDAIISNIIFDKLEMGKNVKNININFMFKIKQYIDFHESWLKFIYANNKKNILINYDSLLHDTPFIISKVLDYLNINTPIPIEDLCRLYMRHDVSTPKEMEVSKMQMKNELIKRLDSCPWYMRKFLHKANGLFKSCCEIDS